MRRLLRYGAETAEAAGTAYAEATAIRENETAESTQAV